MAFLVPEAEFLFDLDLDPQPLAVEPVLITQFVPGHREKSLVGVFVGSAPGVMHAHGVVGGDRAVEKTPLRLAGVFLAELLEHVLLGPKLQDLVFSADKIRLGDFFKHGGSTLRNDFFA